MSNYIDKIKYMPIHFIGCGGAGMAPLALILAAHGCRVTGSDLEANDKTAELQAHGVGVCIGHSILNMPPDNVNTLVVYSSAVKDSNPELAAARKRNWECLRRGEMLARLAGSYRRTVSISGSHGKTSVTAMLVHILRAHNCKVGYMIGGKAENIPAWSEGDGDIFVTEVDESDGSHTLIDSHIGVITNVEDDHCWSVGGVEQLMENFKTFAARAPKIIYVADATTRELFGHHPDRVVLTTEDILTPGYFEEFDQNLFKIWGDYQLINAALAVEAAAELGIEYGSAMRSLRNYAGVARRMTEHMMTADYCLIEDYAHHPTELKASLSTLRKRFPERRLCIVFQPHRYARLERYLEEFAEIIRTHADIAFITPVFAAWSEKRAISSEALAEDIGGAKARFIDRSWSEMAHIVVRAAKPPSVIAVIGAGDINALIPEIIRHIEH